MNWLTKTDRDRISVVYDDLQQLVQQLATTPPVADVHQRGHRAARGRRRRAPPDRQRALAVEQDRARTALREVRQRFEGVRRFVLRAHYPDLVDEDVLGKFGLKNHNLDFGIPSLQTIVEAKFIKQGGSAKKVQEELMVDSVGYFARVGSPYRYLIPFVYNKANVPIDSAFADALLTLPNVAAVVIVPGIRVGA